jgi:hypothetical protein
MAGNITVLKFLKDIELSKENNLLIWKLAPYLVDYYLAETTTKQGLLSFYYLSRLGRFSVSECLIDLSGLIGEDPVKIQELFDTLVSYKTALPGYTRYGLMQGCPGVDFNVLLPYHLAEAFLLNYFIYGDFECEIPDVEGKCRIVPTCFILKNDDRESFFHYHIVSYGLAFVQAPKELCRPLSPEDLHLIIGFVGGKINSSFIVENTPSGEKILRIFCSQSFYKPEITLIILTELLSLGFSFVLKTAMPLGFKGIFNRCSTFEDSRKMLMLHWDRYNV